MAKIRVICPFSNELCKECALYRGRHYYLCFCQKYRGYLNEPGEVTERPNWGASSNKKFDIPPVITTSARDPFITAQRGMKEV